MIVSQAFKKGEILCHLPVSGKAMPTCHVGMWSRAVCRLSRVKLSPLWSSFKESVPVSSYQQAGIPLDLKRKIARLGINMLLKMVSSWARRGRSGPVLCQTACGKTAGTLLSYCGWEVSHSKPPCW